MAKMDIETIDKYRKIFAKDPNSKVFAPLAEALREYGLHSQAEATAMEGIRRHPNYVGGYVVLGRTLLDQERFKQAMTVLKKASEIDPQNLLALELLANSYLQLQMAAEALKTYKMVLFLNPSSQKAKSAVLKLETLSAEDFEEDIFKFKKLAQSVPASHQAASSVTESGKPAGKEGLPLKELERKLSLVDALIVRSDLERAKEALTELSYRAPGNSEIARRFELLGESPPVEEAAKIKPLASRERQIWERKKLILENLLQRIRDYSSDSIVENRS
jgi:tetratricopeptide (TPR) repeat protein